MSDGWQRGEVVARVEYPDETTVVVEGVESDVFRSIRLHQIWGGRSYDLLTSTDAERRYPDPLVRAFHEAGIFLPDEAPYRVDDAVWDMDDIYISGTR